MLCNPQLYGVPIDALDTDPLLQVSRFSLGFSLGFYL
jgi:hypothetical protein